MYDAASRYDRLARFAGAAKRRMVHASSNNGGLVDAVTVAFQVAPSATGIRPTFRVAEATRLALGVGWAAAGGVPEGTLSATRRPSLDERGHAEHVGWDRRRRRTRQQVRSGRGSASDDRLAGGGTILPGIARHARLERAPHGSPWRMAERRSGCRRRRSCSIVAPCGVSLHVELADDAWFLGVESLVFGRAAMGEVVEHASLRDVYEVHRGGRLLLHDAIRLEGEVAATLRRPAVADGARAVATLVYVASDAETMLDPLRGSGDRRQRLGRHADRAYARRRRCNVACRRDSRIACIARRAALAARLAVLRGSG